MEIREAFALDAPAYYALLDFLAIHDSQAHEVSWNLPVDTPVRQILAEPGTGELRPRFMFRVVDISRLFDALASGEKESLERATHRECAPKHGLRYRSEADKPTVQLAASGLPLPGRFWDTEAVRNLFPFIMAISDTTCQWNDGTWKVGLSPDGPRIERADQGTVPDLVMDITAFSQIASGYVTAVQAHAYGKVRVQGKQDALTALSLIFPGKVTFCADYF